jgi:hypothetical protein
MANPNSQPFGSQQAELKIVGRVLNTLGVVFLSICVALSAALYEDLSSFVRTAVGLAIAAGMVVGGQALSRRRESNWWFPTTLMSAGYALAYFFAYSTYYVPNLRMLDSPYLTWGLGLALGAIGTWHGSTNKQLRWFTSCFTLMVTGHATFHALSSAAVISVGGLSVQVAAVACFVGMIWCAALSSVYKRFELRYNWPGANTEEAANWLLHRVLHEAYFVFAALNAMALPLFLSSFEQAPIWWSVQAPILLAISWRSGNYFKHGVVGAIWAAAVVTLIGTALRHNINLAVLVAVPVSGLSIGLAYRFVKSAWAQNLKVAGYCGYLYAAIAVAIVAPYLHAGNVWDAMPYWMIQSLVLCGLGLALRDRIVHNAGCIAGAAALVLFGIQFNTWNWGLVVPVVVASYSLSVAYSRIRRAGGWKENDFLPFGVEQTVSAEGAEKLENLWSWVGCLTLFASSFLLLNESATVVCWAVEALTLVVLGFIAQKMGFRLQGLLAYGLAAFKLCVYDLSGGFHGWFPAEAITLHQAIDFGVLGASTLIASFLYFREEAKLEALANKPTDTTGGDGSGTTGGTGNGSTGGNGGNGSTGTDLPPSDNIDPQA